MGKRSRREEEEVEDEEELDVRIVRSGDERDGRVVPLAAAAVCQLLVPAPPPAPHQRRERKARCPRVGPAIEAHAMSTARRTLTTRRRRRRLRLSRASARRTRTPRRADRQCTMTRRAPGAACASIVLRAEELVLRVKISSADTDAPVAANRVDRCFGAN